MKKSELIKWLEIYEGDPEISVAAGTNIVIPNVLEKVGDKIMLSQQFGISDKEIRVLNLTNAFTSGNI